MCTIQNAALYIIEHNHYKDNKVSFYSNFLNKEIDDIDYCANEFIIP